jgi:hypothetical protein
VDRRAAAKQISPGALALGRHEKRLALKEATDAWVCGQTPQGRLRRTLCLGLKHQWVGRPFRASRLMALHPGLKHLGYSVRPLRGHRKMSKLQDGRPRPSDAENGFEIVTVDFILTNAYVWGQQIKRI